MLLQKLSYYFKLVFVFFAASCISNHSYALPSGPNSFELTEAKAKSSFEPDEPLTALNHQLTKKTLKQYMGDIRVSNGNFEVEIVAGSYKSNQKPSTVDVTITDAQTKVTNTVKREVLLYQESATNVSGAKNSIRNSSAFGMFLQNHASIKSYTAAGPDSGLVSATLKKAHVQQILIRITHVIGGEFQPKELLTSAFFSATANPSHALNDRWKIANSTVNAADATALAIIQQGTFIDPTLPIFGIGFDTSSAWTEKKLSYDQNSLDNSSGDQFFGFKSPLKTDEAFVGTKIKSDKLDIYFYAYTSSLGAVSQGSPITFLSDSLDGQFLITNDAMLNMWNGWNFRLDAWSLMNSQEGLNGNYVHTRYANVLNVGYGNEIIAPNFASADIVTFNHSNLGQKITHYGKSILQDVKDSNGNLVSPVKHTASPGMTIYRPDEVKIP